MALADKLEHGKLRLFCVSSVDSESWYCKKIHPRHRVARPVDALVPRDVEIVDTQEVCHFEDRIPVDEEAAEHLLLGGIVERDLPVGRSVAGLESHSRYSRTDVL